MKTTFWVLFALFMIVYSAEPNIKFKPFSISFESPYIPIALFFLILSISFFGLHYQKKAYDKAIKEVTLESYKIGYEEGVEKVVNEVNKKVKDSLGVDNFVTKNK